MKTLNVSDVRNHLPAIIEEVVDSNETVVVTRYGKPLVSIVPLKRRRAGEARYPLRGTPIRVADDFDAPAPELWRALGVAERRAVYRTTRRRTPATKARAGRKSGGGTP
ncbi:MAG: type II toxin-antitoxin system Phd/YefM family antitoxin [Kiritimatiellae bacterium]|nr:type II toxin-antitoxin system Phd/YefM family antitoxin [Kiritimatiellia bacterium]